MITISDTPVLQFMSPNLQSHIRITGENLQRCLTQYLNRHSVQNASVRVHGVSQLPKRLLTILWSLILILTTLRHFSFVLLQKMKLRMLIRASPEFSSNKAPGHDKVTARVLKDYLSAVIVRVITSIKHHK